MKNFVCLYLAVLALSVAIAPATVRAQNISTVAGGGPPTSGTAIDKTTASVGAPAAVRQDSLGNTYILDNDFGRVYKVDTAGKLTVFAGNGVVGFSGEGGLAANAALFNPTGLCIDASNNVYVADSDNAIVREIPIADGGGKLANHIYTVAGVQAQTGFDYRGDGGPATSAHLHFPDGCSFDSTGNMYIADRGNNAIRVVIGASGHVPAGLPPTDNGPGKIYLFAGSTGAVPPASPAGGFGPDGAPALGAALFGPYDVFVDSHDNVFIADFGNPGAASNQVVREVAGPTPSGTMTAGHIYTVAGTKGSTGPANSGISALLATLNGPQGLFVDATGNLYFADNSNNVIREVAGPTPNAANAGMTAGFIYTIAGTTGVSGNGGNGRPAISATLTLPKGTFVVTVATAAAPAGTILIADSLADLVRSVSSNTGSYTTETINIFAGNGLTSFANAAPATAGQMNVIAGIAIDPAGNLAITELGVPSDTVSVIRGVAAPIATGPLSLLVGQTQFPGFSNSPAPFVVNNPLGVGYDASGNLYIADTGNCIVRKFTGAAIATVAGTEPTTPDPVNKPQVTVPQCGSDAPGGAAVGTKVGAIEGVAIDPSGNLFFSDATNNVIWEVPATTAGTMTAGHAYVVVGTQSPTGGFAGEGMPATQAMLKSPTGISFDIYGNLFIADTGNNLVREVPAVNVTIPVAMTAGSIYTVAGATDQSAGFTPDGQPAVGAKLNAPFTAVTDNVGDIFIADTKNQVVRVVAGTNAGGRTVGDIYTVAGTHGSAGLSGDGAAATSAQLNFPQALAIDAHDAVSGNAPLLIVDSLNNRVRGVAALANVAAVARATPSPATVTFTAQQLGVASLAQPITLSNPGGATLNVSAIHFTGANALDYSETDNCVTPGTVAAGASCTINVVFTPHALGASNASLTISDSAFGTPQTVALAGTGGSPAAVPSPTSLTFPSQTVNTPSTAQVVTITNSGNVATVFTSITVGGANAGDFAQTNTCPPASAGLAVNGTCTITVTFTPTAAGARAGEIDIADNVTGGMQTIALSGTATPAALTLNLGAAAGGSTTQTVPAGQTATYNLQITANQNASVTFTCSGAPTAATCGVPTTAVAVTAGTPAAVAVTVSTTARGMLTPQSEPTTRMQLPTAIQLLPLSAMAVLLLIATLLAAMQSPAGRLRFARAALSACLVLMPIVAATMLVGCGGGSTATTPPPATGTPAGTYTITVTATSGSTTGKSTLTLVVQ